LTCVSGTESKKLHIIHTPPFFFFFKLFGTNWPCCQVTTSNISFNHYQKTCQCREKLKHQPYVGKLLVFLNWAADKDKANCKLTINDRPEHLPFTFCNYLLGKVTHFQIWLKILFCIMLASYTIYFSISVWSCLLFLTLYHR